MSRTTITNFFAGRAVDHQFFLKICQKLKLKWQDVVEQEAEPDQNTQIAILVQTLRQQILLTAGMMRNADELVRLMKRETDQLLADDEQLQSFLRWVQEKASSVDAPCKPATIRAFYFALALAPALARVLARARALALAPAFDLALARALDRNLDRNLDRIADPEFKHKLTALRKKLPNADWRNRRKFQQWWQENGSNWTEELWVAVIQYPNMGHDWSFSRNQTTKLKEYYDVNKLLVDCLNSDSYVSRDVRGTIEETLLLPIEG
ncbi:MAG: hypothetical protein IGS38_22545 [Synechococcales cyanobacterium M58_A2018_015]|nr:hypothetical protein [Synechococcales cyanobacterium M58_A2018_015]